ncbi:MAG: beta-lactamase family protein [Myxococcales bacterium]|nr:beta-lactamase family protein [Myxococcales bacterium]
MTLRTLAVYDLATVLNSLAPIIADAIARKVTPGAVVLVSDGGEVCFHHAFGRLSEDGPSTAPDTIYDAASITKAATSALLMTLVAEGKIDLDTRVAPLLPELHGPGKDQIEVRHLMGHASGLPAHVHFFDRIWACDLAGAEQPWDAIATMAGAEPLAYETGTKTIYSDLGYILLARLIETLTRQRLDVAFADRIAGPLGLEDTQFINQNGPGHPAPQRIAPTGEAPTGVGGKRGMVHAQVHDDNARSSGGVSGHAGLFTTAPDLARFAQALCDAYQGRESFVPQEVVRRFWTTAGAPETSWRMGFDTPSSTPGISHAGDHWPPSGVGHLGFTGTAMWLAPAHNRFVIILANRTYYSWEPSGIKGLRRALMHAIGDAL